MLGIDASDQCRQYNRKTSLHYGTGQTYSNANAEPIANNALFESFGERSVPRTIDKASPITSVDQLYAQVCAKHV